MLTLAPLLWGPVEDLLRRLLKCAGLLHLAACSVFKFKLQSRGKERERCFSVCICMLLHVFQQDSVIVRSGGNLDLVKLGTKKIPA